MTVFLRLFVSGVAGIMIAVCALTVVTVRAQGSAQGEIVCSSVPSPAGVAVDNRCNIYTADKKTGYVFCFSPSNSRILLGRVPGTPTSLAVDSLRNVFVGTESGQIFLIALDGTMVEAYRSSSTPVGLDMDRDGGLIVATRTGKIVKIERSKFKMD